MRIAVCDDNEVFLDAFQKQLITLPMVETVFAFSDYNAFLFSIDEGRVYDAILLDIEWERERDGIDVAEELYKLCPLSKIIYITGHGDRYAQRIFLHRSNLSGFLTKPVDTALLQANLQKVSDAMRHQGQPALVLRQRGAPVSLFAREICYAESRGHTVEIHTESEVISVYERIDALLSRLPASFVQCHKSYLVNMDQVRRFGAGDILLKNGESVPVSRARYAATKQAYFDYVGHSF